MAALLRFGAARACRLLAAYTVRNPSIYQRNSPSFYKEHILKACLPSINASRFLTNDTSANDVLAEDQTAEEGIATADIDRENSRGVRERSESRMGGEFNYERNVRQLGTIIISKVLHRTFKEILQRGKAVLCKLTICTLYVLFVLSPEVAV